MQLPDGLSSGGDGGDADNDDCDRDGDGADGAAAAEECLEKANKGDNGKTELVGILQLAHWAHTQADDPSLSLPHLLLLIHKPHRGVFMMPWPEGHSPESNAAPSRVLMVIVIVMAMVPEDLPRLVQPLGPWATSW